MIKCIRYVFYLTTALILIFNYHNIYAENISKNKSQEEANLLFANGEKQYNSGEYKSAIISFISASKIYYESSNWENYIKSLIEIGHCYKRKGKFKEGLHYETLAETEAIKYLNKKNIIFSDIYHLKGSLIASTGDYEGSIPYYTKAINLKIQILGKEDTSLSTSYNNLGYTFYYLGDFKKALSFYKKAIEIAHNRVVYNAPDVAMFNLSAAIIYSLLGEFDLAKYYFSESLKIGKIVFKDNAEDLSRIWMNIGNFFNQLGRYDIAINALNSAKEVFVKKFGNNYYELASIYTNIGNIYTHKGDINKAMDFYFKALDVYISNYNINHPDIASVYMNIGHSFYEKLEYDKAILYFEKSINIKSSENTFTRIRTYRNIGKAYEKANKTIKAESYLEKAIILSEQLFGTLHYETGKSYLDKGEFYFNNNNKEKSIELYYKALNIFTTIFGKKHIDVAYCNSNIGYYYFSEKQYQKALKYYQQALIALNVNFNNTDIYSNPDINNVLLEQNLIRPLHQKARAFVKLWEKTLNTKDLNASLNTYLEIVKILDKIRTSYTQNSSLDLGSKTNSIYTEAINVCFNLYSLTNNNKYKDLAFELSEKSKAAVLLSVIREIQAKNLGRIPEVFKIHESNIKKEIEQYTKLIYNEELSSKPVEEKLRIWRGKLLALNQQKDALNDYLYKNYPSYFNLKYNTDVLKLHELQNKLTKNQTLIEYTLSDSIIYIFVVNKKKYEIEEVKIDSNFHKNIVLFTSSISSNLFSNIDESNFKKFSNSAYTLYNYLIKPVDKHITGEQLIIIPCGKLNNIPYETLITSLPAENDFEYRNLNYLLYKYSTSYSMSATLLFSKTNKNNAKKEVIAFSPKYLRNTSFGKKNDSLLKNFKEDDITRHNLSELPEAIKEVNSISKYFKTDTYINNKATESNFKKAVSDYDIIHLAMHTIINDKNPMYSKLVFSYPDNENKEDSYLNTYEIFNMDLSARLAVLSACNTGYGKLLTGEGIMSLARGFMYAGCPSIIMTLWTVEDKSSSELISSFYKYLKLGKSKDDALRFAKINHLKNADQLRAHPFFWSGYVSIGDTSPIINKTYLQKQIVISAILIILITVILFILIRRKCLRKKIIQN